nr:hypothetical protein GCM10020063_053070 [Dactylosporangium thailandense]
MVADSSDALPGGSVGSLILQRPYVNHPGSYGLFVRTFVLSDVVWVASTATFHHPVFRSPTADEQAFARAVINDDSYQVFTWDAETASGTVAMMIVAGEVRVDEALIQH